MPTKRCYGCGYINPTGNKYPMRFLTFLLVATDDYSDMSVSNHCQLDCLLDSLFRLTKKKSKVIIHKGVGNTESLQIAWFMGPTWGPPGSWRPQMGPMLAPWTLFSGSSCTTDLPPPHVSTTQIPHRPSDRIALTSIQHSRVDVIDVDPMVFAIWVRLASTLWIF